MTPSTQSSNSIGKQIDRVIGDLGRQVEEFKKTGGNPICVAFTA